VRNSKSLDEGSHKSCDRHPVPCIYTRPSFTGRMKVAGNKSLLEVVWPTDLGYHAKPLVWQQL
jgi:hypothetical protein